MNRRHQPGRTAPCLAGVLLLLAAGRLSPAAEPTWKVLKPSNTGIPGDNTYDIFIDGEGRPWVPGFITFWEEGGMARWDRQTDTWFSVSNVDYPVIASPRFNDIDADASRLMWIGTNAGLLRYDPGLGPQSLTRYDQLNSPLPAEQITQVSVARDGSIWLAVRGISSGRGGLVRHDPAAGTWDVWTTANGLPWGQAWPGWDHVDYAAAGWDPDGGYTVIFGSLEMGAASYKNGVFRWFQAEPTVPMIWSVASNDPDDGQGHLWLNTDQGVVRRNPDGTLTFAGAPGSGRVEAFRDGRAGLVSRSGDVWTFAEPSGWTSRGNWGGGTSYALAEEAPGVLWAGGAAGAARYQGGSWQRYRLTNTGMLGYSIQTIDFDSAGNVYMNGNAGPNVGGFTIFDGRRWTCVNNYNYGLGPVWGQLSDNVEVLCARGNGALALDVGVGGLQEWSGSSYASLNPGFNTFGLEEDTLGRLWSGNWGRLFLYEGGNMTRFDETNSPMLGFEVDTIVADSTASGFVWVATGLGVVHTDGVTWNVYPREMIGLTQWSGGNFLTCAEPVGDGTLWIGTGVGLYHFDTATLAYDVYTPQNSSLPSDEIDHVEVTPDGAVWITSFDWTYPYPGGLTRFDGRMWQTWTMTNSPLPHNQVWALDSRPTQSGYELWVGTASEGVAVLSVTVPPFVPGDINGDGVVNVDDVEPFVRVMLGTPLAPEHVARSDLNGDGHADALDTQTFVELLVTP